MSTPYNMSLKRRTDRGFTLLEVLIALLVMSIGLLGIGKLMLLSARANDSAYMRSQATALAYTILDAMRANRQTAIVQGYDTAVVVPALQACTAASPCTAAQQAQNDTALWNNSLAAQLPGGTGTVVTALQPDALTGANNVTATITVNWLDKVAEQTFGSPAGNQVSVVLETVL
ncbi:MAG TPA: type IV pilus modification protein PilV [Steroidobacteraceae bacterium]|nr:type IV pilus modification protein PilV [Steroidobacteraceae bacterium]